MSKEAYVYKKSCIFLERVVLSWKEIYVFSRNIENAHSQVRTVCPKSHMYMKRAEF